MLNTKTLIQNILDKNAAGVNEAFSAILEQKIAEKIEEITPAISAELFDLEEKAKFDDDDDDDYEEKKAKKNKEKARDNARAAKSKEVDEDLEISEEVIQTALAEAKIPGGEYASSDLVGLHVKHQRYMATARNSIGYYSDNSGSAADAKSAISKAASLEKEITDHPDTKAFHEKHGWKKEHPAKMIAMATSHLHEETEQLDELTKKTLGNYVKKASLSMSQSDGMSRIYRNAAKKSNNSDVINHSIKQSDKHDRKSYNRENGINKAVDRLAKESTENLEEKAKFDDEDGDDYVSKLAKKAKEKVRDKARKAKESSKESSE